MPLEISHILAVLDHEHFFRAGRPARHVFWQGVYQQNPEDNSSQFVAVLSRAGAANRLKLVVQLRCFLVPEASRRPDLASVCLGLGLRQLPHALNEHHGYGFTRVKNVSGGMDAWLAGVG